MSKTAMIWSVSGGIGRAIANQLRQNDWTVIGIGRHPEDVANLTHHAFPVDVSREYDVQTAVHAASLEVDQIDLWIYAVSTPFWDKLPLNPLKDAATPEKVAKRILTAYDEGHRGQLDLV